MDPNSKGKCLFKLLKKQTFNKVKKQKTKDGHTVKQTCSGQYQTNWLATNLKTSPGWGFTVVSGILLHRSP